MPIHINDEQLDQCLFDALYALMQTRSIEELTVGKILERAHVSRSSFYRRYRDKYELLTGSYEHILQSTYLRCVSGAPWKESTAALYRVLAEHPRFFCNALPVRGPNSLWQYICDICMKSYEEILRQHGVDLHTDWRLMAAVQCQIYGGLEVTCQWLKSGMPCTVEEMIDLLYDLLPEFLKRAIEA